MVKVANLSADLTADTTKFDASLKRSSQTLTRTGRQMSRNAETFNKKVSSSFKRAAQSAAAFEGPLGGIAGRLSILSTISGTVGIAVGGAALAVAGLSVALVKAARVGDAWEGSMNRINALLKTTGGASGQTANEIRKFSQELALGTLASVEGVEAASAKLLTFRSISGDTFRRTLVLAQDLAATGFGSLSDNVTQLGKALEDPIRNLGALTRNGVSFTQAQKDVIKSLTETGRAAEAQSIILDTLAKQVGGAGAAEGGQITKNVDAFSQRVDELLVAVDKVTGAQAKVAGFFAVMSINAKAAADALAPSLTQQLTDAKNELDKLVEGSEAAIARLKRGKQSLGVGRGGDFDPTKAVNDQIKAQQELVKSIREQIKAEKDASTAAKDKAVQVQRQLSEQTKADQLAKEAAKVAKEAAKEKQKTVERTQKSIEGLIAENDAKRQQIDLLEQGVASEQEIAAARDATLMIQRLGIDEMSIEAQAIRELLNTRARLTASFKNEQRLRTRANQLIERTKSQNEKLSDQLRELKTLRDANVLSEIEYQRAVSATNEKIDELKTSNEELERVLDQTGDAAGNFFKTLIAGSGSAGDALRKLGQDILGSIGQQLGSSLVKSATSSIFTSIFDGFFAGGGRPKPGKVSIVGEEGPEVFVPDTAGTVIPNDALSGGGGSNGMTIFADMRGASVEAVQKLEQLVAQVNGSIEPRAIDAVVSERARNPALFGGR